MSEMKDKIIKAAKKIVIKHHLNYYGVKNFIKETTNL